MKIIESFLLLLSAHILVACASTGEMGPKVRSYTLDSFKVSSLSVSNADRYETDSLVMAAPGHIKFWKDSILVVTDLLYRNGQVTMIDLRTKGFQRFVPRGRGPNELLSVFDISDQDGNLWLASLQDKSIMRVVKADSIELSKYQMKDGFLKVSPWKDDLILALSAGFSGNRLDIRRYSGETIDTVGSFPILKDSPDIVPANALFQSDICASPDFKHVVVVCKSFEYIDVYDDDFHLVTRLSGPERCRESAKIVETSAGSRRYVQTPAYNIHHEVVSDNQQFMVGYIGRLVDSEEAADAMINTILSFSWSGKPLNAYKFDVEILSFDMDWDTERLYCLVKDEKPYIVSWKL